MLHEKKVAIKEVIEIAYIQGIHGNQDIKKIKTGFHEYFNMVVMKDNSIELVNIDEWLKRIKKMKRENPVMWNSKTTHSFLLLDVTKDSAVAKLEVYKGDNHFSTDYMLLYKFKDGWKIVSKIFSVPE